MIKKYVFIFFILLIILTSIFLIIRYQVEGETEMPYDFSEIVIKSEIASTDIDGDTLWDIGISQSNDIYIYFEKKDVADEGDKIEKVIVENITFNGLENSENIKVLLPTGSTISTLYTDSTKDYKNETIVYYGSSIDDAASHEINENGGMIAFRIISENIGEYKSDEDTEVVYNASLLEKSGIAESDLEFTVNMDIVMEISNGVTYRTNISIDLPCGTFEESATVTDVIEDFSNFIFKRE